MMLTQHQLHMYTIYSIVYECVSCFTLPSAALSAFTALLHLLLIHPLIIHSCHFFSSLPLPFLFLIMSNSLSFSLNCLLPLIVTLFSQYLVSSNPSLYLQTLSFSVPHCSQILTIALSSSSSRQGNRVLHGSTQAWVSTVTVAEAGSVDVELGVLGGEGWCGQGVGRVSKGRRLPQTTAGRFVQRDLLILAEGNRKWFFFSKQHRKLVGLSVLMTKAFSHSNFFKVSHLKKHYDSFSVFALLYEC